MFRAKSFCTCLFAALLCCTVNSAYAEDRKQPPEKTEQENAKTTKKTAPAKKPADSKKAPVFKPTEEISEDLSVPFPIDI